MIPKRYKTCRAGYHSGIMQSIDRHNFNFIHFLPISRLMIRLGKYK